MQHLYITLIQAVMLFSFGLAYFVWQLKFMSGAYVFIGMQITIMLSCVATTLGMLSSSPQAGEFWAGMGFACLYIFPSFLLIFTTQYNGMHIVGDGWRLPLLLFVGLCVGLILSNPLHGLLIRNLNFVPISGYQILQSWRTTALFTFFWGLAGFLLITACSISIWFVVRGSGYQRANNLILLSVALVIMSPAVWYLIDPPGGLWLLPLGQMLSCCLFGWALLCFQLFGLIPGLSRMLTPLLDDGVVLLDEHCRLLYLNSRLEQTLGLNFSQVFKKDIRQVLPQLELLMKAPLCREEQQKEIVLQDTGGERSFDVCCRKMERGSFGRPGWLLTFHDVTQRRRNREMIANAKKEWESTFDAMSSMIILTDAAGYIFRCNRTTSERFSLTYTQILGQNIARLFFGDFQSAASPVFPREGELQFPRLEGWFELSSFRLDRNEDTPVSYVYILQDITSRKETEQQKNLYARRLEGIHQIDHVILSLHSPHKIARAVLEQINEMGLGDFSSVWLVDPHSHMITSLDSYTRRSAFQFDINLPLSSLPRCVLQGGTEYVHAGNRAVNSSPIDAVIRAHGWNAYVLVPLMAGKELLGVLCLGAAHSLVYTRSQIEILREMSMSLSVGLQNAMMFEKIQHLAITDPLTGLYNRRHFFEIAQSEMERTRRFASPLSLVMMDVDYFKHINDQFGHLVGDHVLQELSDTLRANIRGYDILARYGGEEFIVLLPNTDSEQAREFAERLHEVVQGLEVRSGENIIPVTLSAGVATVSDRHITSVEMLIEYADRAMYTAKSTGRNRIVALNME